MIIISIGIFGLTFLVLASLVWFHCHRALEFAAVIDGIEDEERAIEERDKEIRAGIRADQYIAECAEKKRLKDEAREAIKQKKKEAREAEAEYKAEQREIKAVFKLNESKRKRRKVNKR